MWDTSDWVSIILIVLMILLLVAVTGVLVQFIYNDVTFGVNEGIVVNKYYRHGYNTHTGKTSFYHPESYNITLQKEIDGKIRTKTISVPKQKYNEIEINDYYRE